MLALLLLTWAARKMRHSTSDLGHASENFPARFIGVDARTSGRT